MAPLSPSHLYHKFLLFSPSLSLSFSFFSLSVLLSITLFLPLSLHTFFLSHSLTFFSSSLIFQSFSFLKILFSLNSHIFPLSSLLRHFISFPLSYVQFEALDKKHHSMTVTDTIFLYFVMTCQVYAFHPLNSSFIMIIWIIVKKILIMVLSKFITFSILTIKFNTQARHGLFTLVDCESLGRPWSQPLPKENLTIWGNILVISHLGLND